MNKTKIEYLTHSWNPLAMRCTPISAGCANCWHLATADRLAANLKMPEELRRAYSSEGAPMLVESRLDAPFRLKKPAVIGVQFMGDLFHEFIPRDFITEIFDVMCDARAQHHTFLILTKRPDRINLWLNWVAEHWPGDSPFSIDWEVLGYAANVYFGVSVENQRAADERIPVLLQIPAAVRFVSVEPMLELVELARWLNPSGKFCDWYNKGGTSNSLNWIICGSESGPKARPMDEDWVRSLRDQCVVAGTPFFYKQAIVNGQKVSMPTLDGKMWDEMPKR